MYHPGRPDGNYQTANKVHVLDPPRAIGWLTGYDPKGDGHLEFGGWFWRYDLAPLVSVRTGRRQAYRGLPAARRRRSGQSRDDAARG